MINPDELEFRKLLAEARGGDESAVGTLLNKYRGYLLLIANQQMDRRIQGTVGGSDIVQESVLAAQQEFDRFQGETPEQLMVCLRQILLHDVYETGRRYRKVDWPGKNWMAPSRFIATRSAALAEWLGFLAQGLVSLGRFCILKHPTGIPFLC